MTADTAARAREIVAALRETAATAAVATGMKACGLPVLAAEATEAADVIVLLEARVASLEAGLRDTAAALESRLTSEELAAEFRKPYEHPLSALDRARALLTGEAKDAP